MCRPVVSARSGGLLVLCLLVLVALEGSGLQAAMPGDGQRARPNTWSARSSTGRTLAGTWTAVADPATGTVTGTWTLGEAKGTPADGPQPNRAQDGPGLGERPCLTARPSTPGRGAPAWISSRTRALRICSRWLCRRSSAAPGAPAGSPGCGRYGHSRKCTKRVGVSQTMMDPKCATGQTRVVDEQRRSDNWFATFSFLDVGSAISSSQLRRLVATVSKLWRLRKSSS